jgi:hypothetical protein
MVDGGPSAPRSPRSGAADKLSSAAPVSEHSEVPAPEDHSDEEFDAFVDEAAEAQQEVTTEEPSGKTTEPEEDVGGAADDDDTNNATFEDEFEGTATTELEGEVENNVDVNEPADSDDEAMFF